MIRKILAIAILAVWFLVISSLDNYVLIPYPPLTPEEVQIAENLWEHPQPKTDVFMGISLWRRATGSVDEVCAELSQFFIWEPGDYGDDVSSNVLRSNEFKVNNVVVRASDRMYAELGISITRFDNGIMGNVLGSHGGTISLCIKPDNIPDGLNLAGLQFKSTSGKLYSYNWAFKLTKENQVTHVELPDAIKD